MSRRHARALLCLLALSVPCASAWAAEWQPQEKVETYQVSGTSGRALYQSIGQRGPKIGVGRAIAYTNFKLTWQRNYVPSAGGCVNCVGTTKAHHHLHAA